MPLGDMLSPSGGTRHAQLRLVRMGRDDFKDSYYLRAIRTSIGAALRNHYAPTEALPNRFAKLLEELHEAEKRAASRAASEHLPRQSASDLKAPPRRR